MSNDDKCTKEKFLETVKDHKLTIHMDNGVYRHIVCAKPGTNIQRFEIVTFPGYLVYVGDMGSYTFWRTEDMFTFFRSADGKINPRYWGEKLEAIDRCSGREEFSLDKFRENILEQARQSLELEDDEDIPVQAMEDLREVLEQDNEPECMLAARGFESRIGIDLSSYWEWDNTVFTTRFLWCCHAIVWAINKYMEQKTHD